MRRLLKAPEVNVVLFAFLLHIPWEFWQVPFFAGMASAPHWAAVKVCTRAAAEERMPLGERGLAETACPPEHGGSGPRRV